MEKKEIYAKIKEYFEANDDVFNACIEELDDYNGYLGDNRYYDMESLNELYASEEPLEILQRAYFGYDEDTHSGNGDDYGEFNPNRDYFHFNGYGNLVSTGYPTYSEYLDDNFIDELSDNRNEISAIWNDPDLSELFDLLDESEEEESDE